MELIFWGSTDEVTGSMTYLKTTEGYILIDCGLVQGENSQAQQVNKLNLPVPPQEIYAIFITHAHLDHTGFIPRMVKKGFRGKILCTPATAKLMQIILMDSAKLNEGENFYDAKDVNISFPLIEMIEWHQPFKIGDLRLEFISAGHILGASSLVIEKDEKTIVFSGDLGRDNDPLLLPHPSCPKAQVVVMESTYGNKIREADIQEDLERFLYKVFEEKRVGIIASFAVARAQTLLTLIHQFYEQNPHCKVRVVIDSPMMKAANNIYKRFKHLTHCSEDVFEALDEIDAIEYQKEWESLSRKTGPLVIISSSGMLTGGRIGRHLLNWHNDPKAILLLAGYQGINTPGRSLIKGSRQLTGPNDEIFEWKGEVWHTDAFSSHADQKELIKWVKESGAQKVFLLHGETEVKLAFKKELEKVGMNKVIIPTRGEKFEV